MNPASFYNTIYDAPVLPGKDTQCSGPNGPKFGFNTHLNATRNSVDQLRSNSCLPDSALYAEEIADYAAEKSKRVQQYSKASDVFDSYLEAVGVLQTAKGPFDTYITELNAQQSALESEYVAIQQKIRAGRRRFLDNDPQGGVKSVLGLETTDNRILLVFWISYTVAMAAVIYLVYLKYESLIQFVDTKQKVSVFVVVMGILMGIAQIFIRQFA